MFWKKALELTTRSPILTVGILAAIVAAIVASQIVSIVDNTRRATALEAAQSYSSAMSTIRNYYSSVVVPRAREAGATITHDYHNTDGAIPFPATLTIELGEQVSQTGGGGNFRMLSDYPFPWRENGGPRDAFETEALAALISGDHPEFVQMATINGLAELRFAESVKMKESCVACHNTHPLSPKTDWNVGDVRGIQTVRVPLPEFLTASSANGTSGTIIKNFAAVIAVLVAALALIGSLLFGLKMMVTRQKRLLEIARHRNKILAEARRNSDSASRMKSQFMATMSHELRTPLNAVIGFSEVITSEMFGKIETRQYAEFAQHIHNSGEHLLEIINNIIDLSEIESGEYELDESSIDVADTIDKTVELLSKDKYAENLEIITNIQPDLPALHADEKAIWKILQNLGHNAIKFTRDKGTVAISASLTADGGLGISIRDTGIGMTPQDVELAQTPFVQIDGGLSRQFEGTGLGLPLSRRLLELHDGRLEIQSTAGEGTTIHILFPATRLIRETTNSVAA